MRTEHNEMSSVQQMAHFARIPELYMYDDSSTKGDASGYCDDYNAGIATPLAFFWYENGVNGEFTVDFTGVVELFLYFCCSPCF